jgi:hypothetical protein
MTTITLDVKKSPHIMSDTIDEMVIVIHIITGAYYSLTQVGAQLWKKIESGDQNFDLEEVQFIKAFVIEEILIVESDLSQYVETTFEEVGMKFTDMEEMLMGDPIHEVDLEGWPQLKKEDG